MEYRHSHQAGDRSSRSLVPRRDRPEALSEELYEGAHLSRWQPPRRMDGIDAGQLDRGLIQLKYDQATRLISSATRKVGS